MTRSATAGTAAVGNGRAPVPRSRPSREEFAAERSAIDVTELHVYAADWRAGRVEFLIDGEHVKTVHQAPDYPMQMMVAVFDFPAHAARPSTPITCRNWPWTASAGVPSSPDVALAPVAGQLGDRSSGSRPAARRSEPSSSSVRAMPVGVSAEVGPCHCCQPRPA